MMRRIARGDKIERSVRERQHLDRALQRDEVGNSARLGLRDDSGEHRLGQIVRHDFADMRRQREADMSAAAAQIERAAECVRPCQGREFVEVLAMRMNGAGDIGRRARAELLGHQGVNRFVRHDPLANPSSTFAVISPSVSIS